MYCRRNLKKLSIVSLISINFNLSFTFYFSNRRSCQNDCSRSRRMRRRDWKKNRSKLGLETQTISSGRHTCRANQSLLHPRRTSAPCECAQTTSTLPSTSARSRRDSRLRSCRYRCTTTVSASGNIHTVCLSTWIICGGQQQQQQQQVWMVKFVNFEAGLRRLSERGRIQWLLFFRLFLSFLGHLSIHLLLL